MDLENESLPNEYRSIDDQLKGLEKNINLLLKNESVMNDNIDLEEFQYTINKIIQIQNFFIENTKSEAKDESNNLVSLSIQNFKENSLYYINSQKIKYKEENEMLKEEIEKYKKEVKALNNELDTYKTKEELLKIEEIKKAEKELHDNLIYIKKNPETIENKNLFTNKIQTNKVKSLKLEKPDSSDFWEKFEIKDKEFNNKVPNKNFIQNNITYENNNNNTSGDIKFPTIPGEKTSNYDAYTNKNNANKLYNSDIYNKEIDIFEEKIASNMRKYSPYILNKKK